MHDCRCCRSCCCSSTTFVDPAADDDTAAAEPAPERFVFHLQEGEPKILAEIAVVVSGIVVDVVEEEELPKTLAKLVVVEPGIVVVVDDVRENLAMVDVPPMDLEQPFAVVVVVAGQRTDQRMQLMPLKTV